MVPNEDPQTTEKPAGQPLFVGSERSPGKPSLLMHQALGLLAETHSKFPPLAFNHIKWEHKVEWLQQTKPRMLIAKGLSTRMGYKNAK